MSRAGADDLGGGPGRSDADHLDPLAGGKDRGRPSRTWRVVCKVHACAAAIGKVLLLEQGEPEVARGDRSRIDRIGPSKPRGAPCSRGTKSAVRIRPGRCSRDEGLGELRQGEVRRIPFQATQE